MKMIKRKETIVKYVDLPKITFSKEEALRVFGLIVRNCDKRRNSTRHLRNMDSYSTEDFDNFTACISSSRDKSNKGTIWKFSMGMEMPITILDSEITDEVLSDRFVDYLISLLCDKVVLFINYKMKRLEESMQKRRLRFRKEGQSDTS